MEGGEVRGRYSLLGLDPDLVFRADAQGAAVNSHWQTDRSAFTPCNGKPTEALRDLIEQSRIPVPEGLPPALACVVGYFSYETIGMVEDVPRASEAGLGLPDMVFTRPTLLLVFDSLTDKLFCIAPVWASQDTPDDAIIAASERIDEALRKLANAMPRQTVSAGIARYAAGDGDGRRGLRCHGREGQRLHRCRRHLSSRAVAAIFLPLPSTSPCAVPGIEARKSLAIPVPSRSARFCCGRL